MGKLFNAIKKYHDELLKYQNNQENDYTNTTTFNNAFKAYKNMLYTNYIFDLIGRKPRDYFGSNENFFEFLRNNKEIFDHKEFDFPKAIFESDGSFDIKSKNYELMLDTVENFLGEKRTDKLLEEFINYKPKMDNEPTHPYKLTIDAIKMETHSFDFTNQYTKELNEALDYANDVILEKKTENEVDKIIDYISLKRDTIAKKQIGDFGNEHAVDGEKLKNLDNKQFTAISFGPMTPNDQALIAPLANVKSIYSEEYKQKILELDEYINNLSILKNPQGGESGSKEYGFIDFFEKTYQLRDLINNHANITDYDEKVNNLKAINQTTKELKQISKEYDQLFEHIKENFDLDKIALPGNVYSGRPKEYVAEEHNDFSPNLPPKWDNENAPYGVIMNGYCQLKKNCELANVSLSEFMNDPVKCYLKGAFEYVKPEDQKYLLNSSNHTLGKRMAHVLLMRNNAYQLKTAEYGAMNRGFEFLNTTSELDKNTYDNIITTAVGASLYRTTNHSNTVLFGNNNYESLQNLFALGNYTDNLFTVSNNYFDENLERGSVAKTYDNKISSFKNVNPLNEKRRIMETLKDYMIERKNMKDHEIDYLEREDMELSEACSNGQLFVAAKKYFNDYVFKNNINLLNLDKKQRKEVFEFMNDPISAFEKKYGRQNGLFLENENFETLKRDFKQENKKVFGNVGKDFVAKFQNHNLETLNRGKNIATILNDNRGGFFERNFGWSSKEYKALVDAVKASSDPNSSTYGDLSSTKYFAEKYVEHKLPLGADYNRLSANEKRRIDFCQSIIRTCAEIGGINEENKNVLSEDNQLFQNQLKKDVDLGLENNNNIIIEDNVIENVIDNQM